MEGSMRTAAERIRNASSPKAVSTDTLVTNAWLCAYVSLWKTEAFSEREIGKAKGLIRSLLLSAGDPLWSYRSFCQRVLLTHRYLQTHPEGYVPLPSQWLNTENKNGFTGTGPWMDKLLTRRLALPFYKIELKAYAEALLEMAAEPSLSNFIYWKNFFSAYPDLLDLFLNVVALQRFQSG